MAALMPFIPDDVRQACIDYWTRTPVVLQLAMRQRRKKRARQFVVNVRALQRWKAAYDG